MGFRLASAIGGFAKKTSANLDALQVKADDITKTAAKRFAEEANAVRKARISSRGSYSKIANRLSKNYNLNDAQVYALLSGGLEQADLFQNTIEQAELMHNADPKNKGTEFNRADFIQNQVFKQTKDFDMANVSKLSLSDQADAYAMSVAPMINNDFGSVANQVKQATTTALFGGQATGVTKASFDAEFNALMGGQEMPQQGKMDFGSDTMYTVDNLTSVGAADTLAAQTAVLGQQKTTAEIGQINKYTSKLDADINLTESTIDINEETLDKIKADVNLIKANTNLRNKQGKKIVVETEVLEDQLANFDDYNKQEKELGIQLLKQKIINLEGSTFTDLEQFQVSLLNKSTNLKAKARVTEDGTEKAVLENEAQFYANQIGLLADEMNQANPDTDDVFSKSSPDKIYNSIVDRNLQSIIGTEDMLAFGDVLKYKIDGRMPQYFQAIEASLSSFSSRYGNIKQGREFVKTETSNLRLAIRNHALTNEKTDIVDFSNSLSANNKTIANRANLNASNVPITMVENLTELRTKIKEIEGSQYLKSGDVVVLQNAQDGQQLYMIMSPTGELIG